jgi:hypothetical protein
MYLEHIQKAVFGWKTEEKRYTSIKGILYCKKVTVPETRSGGDGEAAGFAGRGSRNRWEAT